MFRVIILPIFRSTRLCVTACGIMHPRCCRPPATSWVHLVSCLYYLSFIIFFEIAKQSQFIPPQNVVYFITLPVLVRKILTFYINDVLLFRCPFPGPKGVNNFLRLGRHLKGRADLLHAESFLYTCVLVYNHILTSDI